MTTPTPAPDPDATIRRKLAVIRRAAAYLRGYARDAAESESATSIIQRTHEIEALLDTEKERAA